MADKHHIIIAMGLGPKSGAPPPPSIRDRLMPPPSSSTIPDSAPRLSLEANQKASREAAGFIPMEQACGACTNFTKETGECAKVEGAFRCCDVCTEYFQAANQAGTTGEPDADNLMGATSGTVNS